MLIAKNTEGRNLITNDITKCEEEIKKVFAQQKVENSRLQQQISQIKAEKTGLQQQLLNLQRRIAELELLVGNEANKMG